MKKFYTLTFALLSMMVASAQNFVVYHGGVAVANGSTITVTEPHNTTLPMGTKYEFNADLTFEGKADGNVTVTGTQVGTLKDDSGVMAYSLCPDVCAYMVDGVITRTFSYEVANGKTDLQLHLSADGFKNIAQPIVYGELDMSVKYAGSSDALTFKLIITNDSSASVSNVGSDANEVSYANNALTVNLENASTVEIYSVAGVRVKTVANVQNETIDLSALPAGIYLYRVAGKTGRVVVR